MPIWWQHTERAKTKFDASVCGMCINAHFYYNRFINARFFESHIVLASAQCKCSLPRHGATRKINPHAYTHLTHTHTHAHRRRHIHVRIVQVYLVRQNWRCLLCHLPCTRNTYNRLYLLLINIHCDEYEL